MHCPKSFRPMLVAALAGCLAVSAMIPAIAQQQPPQPPTKPPEQKKTDPPKGDQKKPPARQGAQVEPPVQDLGSDSIKIDTQMVELDVSVIDQSNRPIFDLNKEDFTVYEDKVKQPIESVNRAEVPVSFGLVIDTSGSMRPKLQTVSDAALGLIKTNAAQ